MPEYADSIEEYAGRHSTPEDGVLSRLYRETNLKTVYPRMCSGPLLGRLLTMLCRMMQPCRVLEIGTFTGYSAICMARGLAPGGKLHTIDVNEETGLIAARYFTEAGLADRIIQHTGDAREIIPGLAEDFDLVFIDGDKEQYLDYYHGVMKKLKTGGYILADNVLWGGKVIHGSKSSDKEARGIINFNKFVAHDPSVEKILLPVRDGLFIIQKKDG